MVYSNESTFLANNVKNLLQAQAIESFIKNEFAQGAIGEISAFDAWPEVWVLEDADFDRAITLIEASQHNESSADWVCPACLEENSASFEICWHCQHAAP